MNQRNRSRSAILAIALLCAAASSASMTLGKASGTVLLGQPLKLAVPVQLDSREGPSVLCFEAEVFYGDTRQDPSRVAVSSAHSPQTQSGNIQVTSSADVDEPVVSVYLRAGCEYKTTRRFVLLADLATETPAQIGGITVAPQTGAQMDVLRPVSGSDERPPNPSTTITRRVAEAPLSVVKPIRAQLPLKNTSIRRPHLNLLPIDLTPERDPTLKLSNDLYLGESESLQRRADAAALWKALNLTPQDILSAESRRQATQSDLSGLQDATAKNRRSLRELSGRLEAAESQRYANPVVFGLIGLLILFCCALAYVLFGSRRGGLTALPWWGIEKISEEPRISPFQRSGEGGATQSKAGHAHGLDSTQHVVQAPAVSKAAAVTAVDIDLEVDESRLQSGHEALLDERSEGANSVLKTTSRGTGHADFSHSMSANLRAVNIQEMPDVRQQADFFMTLGQHEEALRLLKQYVDSNFDSNPLVFLDLLRVLHALGRKVEFDNYRADFNTLFSGHVPVYAAFNQGGEGIEAYPEICHTIESLWPLEQAIVYIEKCLVRGADEATRGMDLEAFRELLMLHGIAKRIASSSESGLMPFITTKPVPVEAVAVDAPASVNFNMPADRQLVSAENMDLGDLRVDLELPTPPDNLIEFDASELSPPDRGFARKS